MARSAGLFVTVLLIVVVAFSASDVAATDVEDIFERAQAGFEYAGSAQILQERRHIEEIATNALPRFPTPSMGGGITWQMHPRTGMTWELDGRPGMPIITGESFGPLYAERAQTVGQGRVFVSFSYARVEYDDLDGHGLDRVNKVPPVRWDWGEDTWLEVDALYGLDIVSDILTVQATVGVTDRWDIGVLVPYIEHDFRVKGVENIRWRDRYAVTPPDVPNHEISNHNVVHDEARGMGDLIVRSKYFAAKSRFVDVSIGLDVRAPTGAQDDLLGTGDVGVKPYLILSKTLDRLTPHLNVGHEWNTSHSKLNAIYYAAGMDVKVHNRLTLAGDIIGTSRDNGGASDVVDGNIGLKINLFDDVLLTASALVPIGNDGLRADVIGTVGLEWAF